MPSGTVWGGLDYSHKDKTTREFGFALLSAMGEYEKNIICPPHTLNVPVPLVFLASKTMNKYLWFKITYL